MTRTITSICLLLLLGTFSSTYCQQRESVATLHEHFLHPQDNARILMRWWWFGPAVTHAGLEREILTMKHAGIGGFEIQPVYPLTFDDPQQQIRNLPYLSDGFLEAVTFASQVAQREGMRVDITLGSGWPFGGPQTPVTEAAGHLRVEQVIAKSNATSIARPALEEGEEFIAAFRAEEHTKFERLPITGIGRIPLSEKAEATSILFYIASRTGMQVKRAGLGAEGFVLDHYDQAALEHHLEHVASPLIKAFGPHPPYAVFSDSLEVYASDWTGAFLTEFQRRRGYDLTKYLPALTNDLGDQTAQVRHDWGQTLTELVEDNYLKPLTAWAHAHQTRFRSQTYGVPPVRLSSNDLVDLPEGEGPQWRQFSSSRWASSASHLYRRPITSSETWTWLHSPAFRATPLDLKAEADRHFLEGINQLIGHGWPYSPPAVSEPGWQFYAAAALNDHNPWFAVMPDLARYLQRMSCLLREGEPANDVAIYLPTDDAWSHFTPGHTSLNQSFEKMISSSLTEAVLRAGHNFDFVDDGAMKALAGRYKLLILPNVDQMSRQTAGLIQSYISIGGHVIATGRLPSHVPGLQQQKISLPRIDATLVQDEHQLTGEIRKLIKPDLDTADDAVGFIHRHTQAGEIYFLANTSNRTIQTTVTMPPDLPAVQLWNAIDGEAVRLNRSGSQVQIEFAPYQSHVLVLSKQTAPVPAAKPPEAQQTLDLSHDWTVRFTGSAEVRQMHDLESWTQARSTEFFSGSATYERDVDLPGEFFGNEREVRIDFGAGTPVESKKKPGSPGMETLLDSPIREVATVVINGKKAGTVWCPPYRLAITPLLHAGVNRVQIIVANTAINELAGQSQPNYHLLNLRRGERFVPQDMKNLEPLPSGLLGPVQMISTNQ